MSDVLPAALSDTSRGGAYFELLLFIRSPFSFVLTAALIFAVSVASYALTVLLSHQPLLAATGPGLNHAAWIALTLSLLVTVIPASQHYVRTREAAEIAALAHVLKGGVAEAIAVTQLPPQRARLREATLIGTICASALMLLFYFSGSGDPHTLPQRMWFAAITGLLIVSLLRGLELTRAGSRVTARVIRDRLEIDLLRIDQLGVFGRAGVRTAAIWFSICAVSFLLLVQSAFSTLAAGLVVLCAGIGMLTFFLTMERVHRRIRAAKHEELEYIRKQIDQVRGAAVHAEGAAQRLQALLAYEARISAVSEWPFDQTTLMRLFASALVLGVPWFGQAVAQYAVEHFAH